MKIDNDRLPGSIQDSITELESGLERLPQDHSLCYWYEPIHGQINRLKLANSGFEGACIGDTHHALLEMRAALIGHGRRVL